MIITSQDVVFSINPFCSCEVSNKSM